MPNFVAPGASIAGLKFPPVSRKKPCVHVGDIMVQGDNLFGDAVNIAARLEALAEPGGICVSRVVRDQIRDKLPYRFEDIGEQSVRNITRPVRAYTVSTKTGVLPPSVVASVEPAVKEVSKPPIVPRLSIVVLPVANLSDDPKQEYFADGITDDLTTDLSRISGSFVIARSTAFTYKGKPVDVKQIGRELGVRYVLEGSVRKAGNRVRISGQLIDTATGAHIWADRFDGALDDIFELQDQVASNVAGAIEPKLRQSEIERASRKPTADLTAYDLYLRALAQSYRVSKEGLAEAVVLARQALAIDPAYAPAAVMVGSCRVRQRVQGWGALSADNVAEAVRLARQALEAERVTPKRFHRLPRRCFAWPARRRWQRRLSIAPSRSTRTRLTPGWPEGVSTRCATSPRRRSKPSNGRAV